MSAPHAPYYNEVPMQDYAQGGMQPGYSYQNMPPPPPPPPPSAPPLEFDPSFAPQVGGMQPWQVSSQNMYATHNPDNTASPPAYHEIHFPAPQHSGESDREWMIHRETTLREWGRKREATLHRQPSCLMDQMMSGSGLFPPRLIEEQEWLTDEEESPYLVIV